MHVTDFTLPLSNSVIRALISVKAKKKTYLPECMSSYHKHVTTPSAVQAIVTLDLKDRRGTTLPCTIALCRGTPGNPLPLPSLARMQVENDIKLVILP